MSGETFQRQAALWGQAYEVFVKRGVLTRLLEERLIDIEDSRIGYWRSIRLAQVAGALRRELALLDVAMGEVIEAAVEHLALCAFGVGYTATREYLAPHRARFAAGKLKARGLYCPVTLPNAGSDNELTREAARQAFARGFGLKDRVDPGWTRKGQPARADFLLWLSGDAAEDHLLVQEYSFDMLGELPDFRRESAHLEELLSHRRLIETRGVFARVSAEVEGESFELSHDIKNYLLALTSENKPLYKLCQASAYGEATIDALRSSGALVKPCVVRALAITPNGLESLVARFQGSEEPDPRRRLMLQMGAAYRQADPAADGSEAALCEKVTAAFNGVLRRLPRAVREGMRPLQRAPEAGHDFEFEFTEQVEGFVNPTQRFDVEQALGMIGDSAAATAYFSRAAREAIEPVLRARVVDGTVTLRDMHAAAIVAAMRSAQRGQLNVLALEGNPGIGKTTAVTQDLRERQSGYLFLYLSPRVVINRDVTDKMARDNGTPTGTLTLTANAQLIAAAERWYRAQLAAGNVPRRHVQSAVVADGVENLCKPSGSTYVLSPEDEAEIESAHAGSRVSKTTLSEHEDLVRERPLPGVLFTLATTVQELLNLNPQVSRVVLTAALQGFREKSGGRTTLEALSSLFKNRNAFSKGGRDERRVFARRHPTIVVMVDELAGDGAGAPFVHSVARWLAEEFVECFVENGESSPFTVVLVVADASLANDVVLDRYLNAGPRTPDKVLVSRSDGALPFQVLANEMRLGGAKRSVLHVMTNSFPASSLDVRYRVRLSQVRLAPVDGSIPAPRKAIRDAMGETLLESAATEILKAIDRGALQVIFFAQDKAFLGDLRLRLTEEEQEQERGLNGDNVQILDASISGRKRKWLVEPENRDRIRVFLMTSSGARGVSFPKTDWIVVQMPRFAIECALMEISQLLYRGRGQYVNEVGERVSGDDVARHVVMLVDDFLVAESVPSPRQWLRQGMDLMTLLVMLRATLLTRMTGDSGLRQKIAFVPVGGTGLDEIVSLMAQFVGQFLRECEIYVRRSSDGERKRLVKRAQGNVVELFSNTRLRGEARKDADGRSFSKSEDAGKLLGLTGSAIAPLITAPVAGGALADHMFFAGPLVLESWRHFDKMEMFSFEGHETQTVDRSRQLYAQLREIDEDSGLPAALRIPASNLLRVLAREKPEAANEFNTLKALHSPNVWVALPAGYAQFVRTAMADGGSSGSGSFRCEDPEAWRDALGGALMGGTAVVPAVARYESFPWAAVVGRVDPLRLGQVFDDRYFMASSEMNLLNVLLLEERG